MKMNKSLIALCLSAGLLASAPGISLADVNYVPQNTSDAPAIPSAALQQLTWTPVDQSKTQTTQLSTGGQQLNVSGISGPVAAYSVPANIGELTLTLTSEVNKQTSVFAPNVLILDQNMTPSAFFPSSYFTYQEPGVMSADRLEGVMRLTPALGQQKLYVLVFTTEKDLQQTTQLLDPAKAYAKGVGNSVPDIPDPIARHITDGLLKLKVKTNSSSSVLVGPLFGSSAPAPVTVGNTAAPAVAAPAPAPVKKSEPMLNDTESYFNTAI
ncbi:MAG: maltose operon protein MalM, partial [Escherichia coli]|nr:maltose operon protein MalM [Escherichia coli]